MTIVGAFLVKEIRTGGHTRYLELMEGLARRGNRVVVLMNELLGYRPQAFEAVAYPVKYRRHGFPPASWVFQGEARKRAHELLDRCRNADAALVFGETHLHAGLCLAKAFGAPLVYGHRSNSVREVLTYLSEPGLAAATWALLNAKLVKFGLDERRVVRAADLMVFQSDFDRLDFISRNPRAASRACVVRGDISGPRFKAQYAEANKSVSVRRVAFIGTLGKRKGADYLVDAIDILTARGMTDLRFDLFGPGERHDEIARVLKERGLSERVAISGRIPDPFALLASTDLLVVPSLFDSYPNTVLEALHVGTPVIGSRVGGIPDQLVHDELLFPPMDAGAIAARIERCVREPGFYTRLRELCAGRRAAFVFDWPEAWERAIAALGPQRAASSS